MWCVLPSTFACHFASDYNWDGGIPLSLSMLERNHQEKNNGKKLSS